MWVVDWRWCWRVIAAQYAPVVLGAGIFAASATAINAWHHGARPVFHPDAQHLGARSVHSLLWCNAVARTTVAVCSAHPHHFQHHMAQQN